MVYNYHEWIKNPYKIFCRCGCNKEIIVQSHHKYYGIPEYMVGHASKDRFITEETRKKLSVKMIGNNNPMKREDVRKKSSKSHEGKIPWNKGLQGYNSGEKNPRYGKLHSKETKDNWSKKRKGKYCKENNPNWRGGITHLPYCEKWNKDLREEIREQYGRKCYICGKAEKDNKYKNGRQVKLSIHHLDLDKEQGCNGKKWKLIPLCKSCHGKIHYIYWKQKHEYK